MKKNSTCRQSPRRSSKARRREMTIGMDLGDKTSRYCVLDEQGEVVEEQSVAATKKGVRIGDSLHVSGFHGIQNSVNMRAVPAPPPNMRAVPCAPRIPRTPRLI
jgi:hypothetical protein